MCGVLHSRPGREASIWGSHVVPAMSLVILFGLFLQEDRPKKKAKSTSKGISLSDYLPAPTNDIKPAKEVPLLGAGVMQVKSRFLRIYYTD